MATGKTLSISESGEEPLQDDQLWQDLRWHDLPKGGLTQDDLSQFELPQNDSPQNQQKGNLPQNNFAQDEMSQDDLPQDEFDIADESQVPKHVHIVFDESSEEEAFKSPFRSAVLRYLKVALLCVIWLIYTMLMVTHADKVESWQYVSVVAAQPSVCSVPWKGAVSRQVEVHLVGPFREAQSAFAYVVQDEPFVKVGLEMAYAGSSEVISQTVVVGVVAKDESYNRKLSKVTVDFNLKRDISDDLQDSQLKMRLHTNVEETLTLKIGVDLNPVNKAYGISVGTVVLLLLYFFIIWDLVNRTFAAVTASTLAIGLLASMDAHPAIGTVLAWVDVETIMLLFGMMVLVSLLSQSGVFDYLAVMAYEVSRGNLLGLIYVLCFFTAVLSAFLDNVTMMLLMSPVTIRLCEVCNLNPVPVLMSMVIYSNIGAALTPVGDPPNVLIMTNHFIKNNGVNFGNFCLHMLLPGVMSMVSTFLQLKAKYPDIAGYMNKESAEIEAVKHEIQVWEKAAFSIAATTNDEEIVQSTLMRKVQGLKERLRQLWVVGDTPSADYATTLAYMKSTYSIRNKVLLAKAVVSFAFVLVLFFLHTLPHLKHLSLGWSALVGALLLLILADEEDIEVVLSQVEWATLLFFACLFTLMEALTELGLIGVLGDLCIEIISRAPPDYRLLVAILLILWVSGIASAFLANIPVTTMMVKIVISLAQNEELKLPLTPLVWSLALGACFGGNGTLIGASANVVCSGVAEQHGYRISFTEFFALGFLVMLNTLVVASIYLLFAHVLVAWH